MAETPNGASLGFEKKIWDAACILRGNMDAAEYKHVVLGLIFLKYISDCFQQRHDELTALGQNAEKRDSYLSRKIFYAPPSARWEFIEQSAEKPELIGEIIDSAMKAIELENPTLVNILPKNYARPELDKRRLSEVVKLFSKIGVAKHGNTKDILGRTYEYCLARFAEQEGKRAGEFYTPSCVVRTLVEVLQPYSGKVYDPCCGSGGMFVQSAKFIERHQGDVNKLTIYGQDSNPTTWKLCKMNLAVHGLTANLGPRAADTFFEDLHPDVKVRFIMANPPFNLSNWGTTALRKDSRWKGFRMPPAGNANYAWLLHKIYHLDRRGRMGVVLANGSLSSQGIEAAIRREIIRRDLLEGIVAMPPQLFYTTQIPVSLWFINKNKKRRGRTLFVDAREMGTMVSRRLREMTSSNIEKIADAFEVFRSGTDERERGFCTQVTTEEIARQNYIITPSRYIEPPSPRDDGEPLEQKLSRLTGELSGLVEQGREMDQQIRERLEAMGIAL